MERSRDWIDQAEGDLLHARNDVAGGYYEWACFSAQQAAEKAVKAVFQRLGAEAWGHSVADLLQELAERRAVPDRRRDTQTLTPPARRARGTRRGRRRD